MILNETLEAITAITGSEFRRNGTIRRMDTWNWMRNENDGVGMTV